jgi:hypothetical protein
MLKLDYRTGAEPRRYPVPLILGISSMMLVLGYQALNHGLADDFWFAKALAALCFIPLAGIVAVIGVIVGSSRIRRGSNLRSDLAGIIVNGITIVSAMITIYLELR